MKVLLTAINYAPERSGNAPYTTGLAEHLVERGHEVHVIAGMPHYPEWRLLPLSPNEDARINGVYVHRRRHYIPRNPSALHRAIYEASFLGTASALGSASVLRGIPRPDVTIGIVPTLSNGVTARLASVRYRSPYGILFQDLMGRAAGQSGIAGGSKVEGIIQKAEGWVARGASRVAMVAEGFRPYLSDRGVAENNLHRVRNWTHLPSPSSEALALRSHFGWRDDETVLLHAGNMGAKQGLDIVIEAARLARDAHPHLRFVLMGDGNQAESLRLMAAQYALPNLQFLPSQPDDLYVDALAAADALLLSLNPNVTDMAFPSKVGSYVASGRPILGSVAHESEIGKELVYHGAALMTDPSNPGSLVEGLLRLSSDDLLVRRLVAAQRSYGASFARGSALEELEDFVLQTAGQTRTQRNNERLAEVA